MKHLIRIARFGLLSLLGVALLAATFVVFMPDERVREAVRLGLESALERPVSIQGLTVDLGSQIRVQATS